MPEDVRLEQIVRRLLVIEPHPDDLILMCGATVKRLTENGVEVYVVTYTHSGGSMKEKDEHRIQRIRQTEEADRILGIDHLHREILEHDTRQSWDTPSILYLELLEKIREIHPDLVITMHNDHLHLDHMWIGEFAEPLVYQGGKGLRPDLGGPVNARLWLAENTRRQLRKPTVYVDVTQTYQSKEDALKTQKTELGTLGPRIFTDMRALATYRAIGMPLEVKYCEAFQEIPIHYKNLL